MTLVFPMTSFNINGTKDKDFVINKLCNDFNLVYLQEHLLTDFSNNLLRGSPLHDVFFTAAKATRGHPSGASLYF